MGRALAVTCLFRQKLVYKKAGLMLPTHCLTMAARERDVVAQQYVHSGVRLAWHSSYPLCRVDGPTSDFQVSNAAWHILLHAGQPENKTREPAFLFHPSCPHGIQSPARMLADP